MGSAPAARPTARSLAVILVGTAVVAVLVVAAGLGLAVGLDVEFDDLSRDPPEVFNGPAYAGVLANLVSAGWVAGASCALLGAAVLRRPALIAVGSLTAVLGLDDLFQLHEIAADTVGLPVLVLPIGYGIAALGLGWVHREAVRPHLVLLAVALVAVTASVVLGVVTGQSGAVAVTALKLVGVGLWVVAIVRWTLADLRAGSAAPDPEAADPIAPASPVTDDDTVTRPVPVIPASPNPRRGG